MKRTIKILVTIIAMAILFGADVVWAEGVETVTVQNELGEVIELTPVPEEIINFTAEEIFRNAKHPLGFGVKIGDRLKDYFLIPIYDVNDTVVRYWAVCYFGVGEEKVKTMEEIIDSLWYPYKLWEQEETICEKLRENTKNLNDKNITKEEYDSVKDELNAEIAEINKMIRSYQDIKFKYYKYATIGAYYEIPPMGIGTGAGLLSCLEYYWQFYYYIKQKYQTDDIEFIKLVYGEGLRDYLVFRAGDDHVYVTIGRMESARHILIYEQEQFVGFNLNTDLPDFTNFWDENDRRNFWEPGIERYEESL